MRDLCHSSNKCKVLEDIVQNGGMQPLILLSMPIEMGKSNIDFNHRGKATVRCAEPISEESNIKIKLSRLITCWSLIKESYSRQNKNKIH
jgi:hypothetical protein